MTKQKGPKERDITGQTFGEYTALRKDRPAFWWFRCSCGNEVCLRKSNVIYGQSTKCHRASGQTKQREEKMKYLLSEVDRDILTVRQKQLYDLLIEGYTQAQVAKMLDINQSTVHKMFFGRQVCKPHTVDKFYGGLFNKQMKANEKEAKLKVYQGYWDMPMETLIETRDKSRVHTNYLSKIIRERKKL